MEVCPRPLRLAIAKVLLLPILKNVGPSRFEMYVVHSKHLPYCFVVHRQRFRMDSIYADPPHIEQNLQDMDFADEYKIFK